MANCWQENSLDYLHILWSPIVGGLEKSVGGKYPKFNRTTIRDLWAILKMYQPDTTKPNFGAFHKIV